MTGWADISAEQLRAELDSFTGDDGMGNAEGWYTTEELSALYVQNRHTINRWMRELLERGRVEVGERQARAVDGRRIVRKVYRLVPVAKTG